MSDEESLRSDSESLGSDGESLESNDESLDKKLLYDAIYDENTSIGFIKYLLRKGADPNASDQYFTALDYAINHVGKGSNKVIKILKNLLKYGADINKRIIKWNGKQSDSFLENLVRLPWKDEYKSANEKRKLYNIYNKIIKFALDNGAVITSKVIENAKDAQHFTEYRKVLKQHLPFTEKELWEKSEEIKYQPGSKIVYDELRSEFKKQVKKSPKRKKGYFEWEKICEILDESKKEELLDLIIDMGLSENIKDTWSKKKLCDFLKNFAKKHWYQEI
jgi:hypothetical protein